MYRPLSPLPQLPAPSEVVYETFDPRVPQQLLTLLADESSSMHGAPIDQVNTHLASLARVRRGSAYKRNASRSIGFIRQRGHSPSLCTDPKVPTTATGCRRLDTDGRSDHHWDWHNQTTRGSVTEEPPTPKCLVPYTSCLLTAKPQAQSSCCTQPPDLIREAEQVRQGAFYAFATNSAAVEAMQWMFPRKVHLLPKKPLGLFPDTLSLGAFGKRDLP